MFSKQAKKRVWLLMLAVLVLGLVAPACMPQPTDTPIRTDTPRLSHTPEPTNAPGPVTRTNPPVPPTSTDTPSQSSPLSTPWYGVVRTPADDWPIIRENLGASVVELVVQPDTPLGDIIASLDSAQALGYQAVFHIYDGGSSTKKPWYLDRSGRWVFPQYAVDMLQAVSVHPAMFAVYALHEPLDRGGTYASVEQQQALYNLLKVYTGELPVWTDIGGLSVWEERGVPLADGMCDYCCTFPSLFRSDWTSEECLEETLRRIDADRDTQQRLMPNSRVVSLINTYAFAAYKSFRLPSAREVDVVRDYLCSINQPILYYPWHHSSYDATLESAPELWPTIAEGCTG